MKKRLLSTLLTLCMVLALLPAAALAADGPAKTNNVGLHSYQRWAIPVRAYLYENDNGGLTRVEYDPFERCVVAEDYSSDFTFERGRTFAMELDKWGGFFAGENYNFIIFGQENKEQDDNKEVIRVVKYSKDWQRLGQASLYGANTVIPFDAGSLRAAEYNGELYIRTCHEMYTSRDGLNHQANLTMAVRESDMTVLDSYYIVMNSSVGYVSHSFNQFVIVDQQQRIVTLDHGDAYPRSAVLMVYNAKAGRGKFSGSVSAVNVQSFPGGIGNNTTGAAIGGLAETDGGYAVAYNYDGAGSSNNSLDRSVYFAYVTKNGLSVRTNAISNAGATTPFLVPTGLDGGYILWNACNEIGGSSDTLYYTTYSDGGSVGEVKTATAYLSECQPIVYNGKVVWFTTLVAIPTFYQLDENGVTAVEAKLPSGGPDTPDGSDTPANSVSVTVNGKAAQWTDAAPFIDEHDRTMVPFRAVAEVMGLEVDWDAAAREAIFTNGSKTMYFPIGSKIARTSDGGTVAMDTEAVIVNDRTYAPIRYLAQYFGYEVDWDAATRTVIIK